MYLTAAREIKIARYVRVDFPWGNMQSSVGSRTGIYVFGGVVSARKYSGYGNLLNCFHTSHFLRRTNSMNYNLRWNR